MHVDLDRSSRAGCHSCVCCADPAARRAAFLAHRAYIDGCVAAYAADGVRNAADYIERCCARYAPLPAIEAVGDASLLVRPITYAQLDSMAARMACMWAAEGLAPAASAVANPAQGAGADAAGTAVALLMENCPLFIVSWFSLAKIGRTVALLNTSLKAPQLRHALAIAHTHVAVVSERYRQVWGEVEALYAAEGMQPPKVYWSTGSAVQFDPILHPQLPSATATAAAVVNPTQHIESSLMSPSFASESLSMNFGTLRQTCGVNMETALFYIYTSGTTGPSKAALFSHRRFLGAGLTWAGAMCLGQEDRYLVALPLFHGNGGVVALSACVHVGARVVLREKFSVKAFWKDVQVHQVTAMIYVGELWRYLYNAACRQDAAAAAAAEGAGAGAGSASGSEAIPWRTTLRVIAGNGLRADIWPAVLERFGIPRVVEHYGMTEMPAGPYLNFYGVPGSCGYIPEDVRSKQGADKLVRFDVEQNCAVRVRNSAASAAGLDELGVCIEVTEAGAVGEALFLLAPGVDSGLSQASNPHTEGGAVDASNDANTDPLGNALYKPYRNYTDPAACARRVYRSVFSRGDAWFATGDLLFRDKDGFFFFADRVGDSFRWKGENVATNEVGEALAAWDPRVDEANVYGVEWAGQDGRAGMASIRWKESGSDKETETDTAADAAASSSSSPSSSSLSSLRPTALLHFLLGRLPAFAVPAFLRVRTQANSQTSTLKFQKFAYQKEGFNPATIVGDDELYWWPGSKLGKAQVQAVIDKEGIQSQEYIRITPEVYQTIIAQE